MQTGFQIRRLGVQVLCGLPELYMTTQKQLFELLDLLGISHKTYHHKPVFTVAEANSIEEDIPGVGVKNLFLKDDKKRFWLISACHDTKINLRKLSKSLGAPGLRFAKPEDLKLQLGVEPGAVTWLALMNNANKEVQGVLDKRLLEHDLAGLHPLTNNATTVLKPAELIRFAEHLNISCQLVDFEQWLADF